MPTSLDYSINILKLQHFKDYIISSHPTFTVNYIITNSDPGNNSVSIEFNETLSGSDITLINTTVSLYVNDNSRNIDFVSSYSLNQSIITLTSYKSITKFTYRPIDGDLQKISFISMKNSLENFTYSLRIVDLTNATIIGELTGLSNTNTATNTIDALTNLPNTESIFEIQGKIDTTNDFGAILYSFELQYFQV